jgi:glycosyltransferase involved in cell wall biosynthesis
MPSLVSVIVPNYNHGRFLPERLDSIAAQTFRDFEVILMDDASTDGSVEVLKQYGEQLAARLVFNDHNSGSPFLQWEKGARLARGKYLWIAESDDYADAHFLERLVEKLESDPRLGLAYAQSKIVDEEGTVLGSWERKLDGIDREHWSRDYVSSGREECGKYLLFANTIPNASAVLVRRDVFLAQAEKMPPMRLCGDWLLWVRILTVSDLAFIAEPLNHHREHRKTVRSTTRLGQHFAEYTVVWQHIARMFRNDPAVEQRLRKAIEISWSFLHARLDPKDDWKWFVSFVRRLWVISPQILASIFRSYRDYRLEHFELGFGLRRCKNWLLTRQSTSQRPAPRPASPPAR